MHPTLTRQGHGGRAWSWDALWSGEWVPVNGHARMQKRPRPHLKVLGGQPGDVAAVVHDAPLWPHQHLAQGEAPRSGASPLQGRQQCADTLSPAANTALHKTVELAHANTRTFRSSTDCSVEELQGSSHGSSACM